MENRLRQEMAEALENERLKWEKEIADMKKDRIDSEAMIDEAKKQYESKLQENISSLKKEFEDDLA